MKNTSSYQKLNKAMDRNQKIVVLTKLKTIRPLTEWDDIEEKGIYHIPPLVYNKRRDFQVIQKIDKDTMRVRYVGKETLSTIYRTDITSNFIVKRLR